MTDKLTFKGVSMGDASQPTRVDVDQLFQTCKQVITALRDSGEMVEGVSVFDDLVTRLNQLQERYVEAMKLNDDYLGGYNVPWFDPEREALVREIDGQIVELFKLNRAHPDQPVQFKHLFQGVSFVPGATLPEGAENLPNKDAEIKLSAKVEDFYYAASRFWDIVEKDFLGKSGTKFIGVKMVRNRLLEHAEKGLPNSFGVTDQHGPVVKPARNSVAKEAHFDKGLIINTYELLDKSIAKLS